VGAEWNPRGRLARAVWIPFHGLSLYQKCRLSRILEHLAHSLPGFGRALEVLLGADLLRYGHALLHVVGLVSNSMTGVRE
jgi:hypothetical protein